MRPAFVVDRVGKSFRYRDAARAPTFRAWVEGGFRGSRRRALHWALRDVSLTVAPGEMLGVIGRNGAGKSTLLRLMAGVMRADEGRIAAAAPVRGLLELNTGMHPDLTGRENIVINGVLSGLLKSEVMARMDQIIRFAELEDSIDQPVRTYSSGMKLRLGFSVAVHVDPQILLIDEVLAVGDLPFQEKCLARIAAFRRKGCAIVLISHNMAQVREFCDRAIWLDEGRLRAEGDADAVVDAYETMARAKVAAQQEPQDAPQDGANRFGTKAMVISDVALTAMPGEGGPTLAVGDPLSVGFTVTAETPGNAHLSLSITDAAGTLCFDANSATDAVDLGVFSGARRLSVDFARLDLAPGRYHLSLGVWKADWSEAFDMHSKAYPFEVTGQARLLGIMSPPRSWRMEP